MDFMNKSCVEYSTALAAKQSVPGGGGAASFVAALGSALGAMAANFTVGKKNFIQYDEQLKTLITKADKLRWELLDLSEQDAVVFDKMMQVYKLPATTEEEKAHKKAELSICAEEAAQVPMQTLKCGLEALKMHKELSTIVNPMLISDIACGTSFVYGAMESALPTVYINLESIADKDTRLALLEESDKIIAEARQLKEDICDKYILPLLRKKGE